MYIGKRKKTKEKNDGKYGNIKGKENGAGDEEGKGIDGKCSKGDKKTKHDKKLKQSSTVFHGQIACGAGLESWANVAYLIHHWSSLLAGSCTKQKSSCCKYHMKDVKPFLDLAIRVRKVQYQTISN